MFRFMRRIPWGTCYAQTVTLMTASDAISQTVLEGQKLKDLDLKRVGLFSAVGVVYVAPGLAMWYAWLNDRYLKTRKSKIYTILAKVAWDQIAFTPPFMAGFLIVFALISGANPWNLRELIWKEFVDIMILNYKVWPAIQCITFGVIPLKYQIVFTLVVATLFNIYITWYLHGFH